MNIFEQMNMFMQQQQGKNGTENEKASVYYIGLNKGPQVVRLYLPNLPFSRKSPFDPKIVWTSRLLDPVTDTLVRIFWPVTEKGEVDRSFPPLQILYSLGKDSPFITRNKKSTSMYPQSPYPKRRVLINAYDRITNRVGVLCEKVFYPPNDNLGLGYPMDIGISFQLFEMIIELLFTIRTVEVDLYIHRKVEGNQVLYSIREYSKGLNHKYLSTYGKEEAPIFEPLVNLDDISVEATTEYLYQRFSHLFSQPPSSSNQVSNSDLPDGGSVQSEDSEASTLSEEEKVFLEKLASKSED